MERIVAKALVVAVGTYDHHEPLPKAVAAASELANYLEKTGYALDNRSLLGGGDHTTLGTGVDQWLSAAPKGSKLVLFWTGHGEVEGNGHYLVARNSPKSGFSGFNAIKTDEIGVAIAHSNAEKILVVLDTCYSGQGASDIASSLSQVLATRIPCAGEERAVRVSAYSGKTAPVWARKV